MAKKPGLPYSDQSIRVCTMDRMVWYRRRLFAVPLFSLALAVPFFATLAATEICSASPKDPKDQVASKTTVHRIVVQVNSDDPITMKHAITNSLNAIRNYSEKNEPVAIEIVAYGPGVRMFRADTSPVKDLLAFLHANHPDVVFSMCGNTKMIMEKNEGHPLSLIDGTQVVPFGVVRLVELQEAGWSYLRP
jgi:intracellular sulfur oxidation DsrE/DsrF family protein